MLVMMADLMSIPVGNLFVAAILPGLLLAGLYCLYIVTITGLRPHLAPPVKRSADEVGIANISTMLIKNLLPIVFLIVLVLGSIFAGWATPTEAARHRRFRRHSPGADEPQADLVDAG